MANNADPFENFGENQADAVSGITDPRNAPKRSRRTAANLLEADFYKVSKLKSIYIAPAVMFFILLLSFAMYWMMLSLADSDLFEGMEEVGGILTAKGMLFGFSSNINLGLFIAIILGIFIGGEFSSGTIKTMVARGSDRVKIYFSKWTIMATLIVAYSLLALIVSGIFTAIKGYGEPFTATQFGLLMRSFVLQVLASIASGSIFLMIAFLCRSAGSAIGLSLGLYILSGVVIGIIASIAIVANSNTEWMLNIIDYLPSNILADAAYAGTYKIGDLMRIIFMPIAYIAASSLIGCLTFVKRDIK